MAAHAQPFRGNVFISIGFHRAVHVGAGRRLNEVVGFFINDGIRAVGLDGLSLIHILPLSIVAGLRRHHIDAVLRVFHAEGIFPDGAVVRRT